MELNFSASQQEVVDSVSGNVFVNATAGSGKTTALVGRIDNLINNHHVPPQNILAVTFSRDARENLVREIAKLPGHAEKVIVRTFHGLAYIIISHHGIIDGMSLMNYAERIKYLEEASEYSYIEPSELSDFISQAKTEMLTPEDPAEKFSHITPRSEWCLAAYKMYEQFKQIDKKFEYDDYINLAIHFLEENPRILESYRQRLEYIMIDEYQDINLNQEHFINLLRSPNNLMVVGDVFQAIYGFRGGKSDYLLNFRQTHEDAKLISMNENRRCTDKIVNAANKIARTIPDSCSSDYVDAVGITTSEVLPQYHECKDEYAEAEFVLDTIRKNNYDPTEVFVLARTNAQLQPILTLFAENRIPVYSKEAKTFLDISEVKSIISYINLSNNPRDNEAFEAIYNVPNRYLGKKFMEKVRSTARRRNISYYEASLYMEQHGKWRYSKGIVQLQNAIKKIQKRKPKSYSTLISGIRKDLKIDDYFKRIKGSEKNSNNVLENLDSFQHICHDITTYAEFTSLLDSIKKSKCADF